ncbi:hypothetical protein [Micromonospora sp. DT47]|uniref:hypothetical protein n=1 Tax=Micromonospora sp. DT47 TaxID=3393431 RepID=UPI003CEDD366
MKTPRMALAALVACAALSGCGGQGGDDRSAAPSPPEGSPVTTSPEPVDPTASAPPAPTVAPPTALPPTGRPPSRPSRPPGPGATTITGTVQPGVEPNCLLIDGYQLIGGPRDVLAPGARVTVTGRPQPDMMTTCQQGTPFVVESARRA